MSDDVLQFLVTEVDKRTVTLKIRPRTWSRYTTHREYTAKPRMYVSVPNESVFEDFANRTSRPYLEWKKVLRAALEQLGWDAQLRWSQKAGCSCPCSPGFIVTTTQRSVGDMDLPFNYDVWATIEGAPAVREGNDLERINRAEQLAAQL